MWKAVEPPSSLAGMKHPGHTQPLGPYLCQSCTDSWCNARWCSRGPAAWEALHRSLQRSFVACRCLLVGCVCGLSGCRAGRASQKKITEHLGLHLFSARFSLLPSLMYASERTSLGNGLKKNQRESRYQHGTESGGPVSANHSSFMQLLAKNLPFRQLEFDLCYDT